MDKLNYIDIFEANFPFFIADTVFTPSFKSAPHSHNFYEFFLLKEGSLNHTINGTLQILIKGDAFFVLPNDQHWFELAPNCPQAVLTNMAFTSMEYDRTLSFLQQKGIDTESELTRKITPNVEVIDAIIKRFNEIYQLSSITNKSELLALFRLLLIEIVILYIRTPMRTAETPPIWLSNACKQMELQQNYVQGISRFFTLTEKTQEHVTRTLKKHHGITPSELINDIRLIEAARILRNTIKTVGEIISETGFENPSYFNRLFKARYGQSPLKYRRSNYSIMSSVFGIG